MALEPFPERFFASARKALSVFDALKADRMCIGAVSGATWGRARAATGADFAVSPDLLAAPELDGGSKGAGFDKESGPREIPGKRLILSKHRAPGPAAASVATSSARRATTRAAFSGRRRAGGFR
jgi:hypothetical protein